MDFYSLSINKTLEELQVNKLKGLSTPEATKRLKIYGENTLVEKKNKSTLKKFIEQFSDFMVIILLLAAVISFVSSYIDGNAEYIDSIIILVIVFVNALMGVLQQNKAEKAIDSLKKLASPKAHIIRGGKQIEIESKNVVPGDIIMVKTGDLVCADARLIESYNLKTQESSLTGESLPVEKNAHAVHHSNISIAERKNMIFATSSVTTGHAIAVVTDTGMNTEVGKIAHMINEENSPQTPLQSKLTQIGKYLGIGAVVICFFIFILGVINKTPPLEMFMISISLAVAAIPEGLPAIVTIVLALGVRRMTANRAIIRKLPVVETLGSANVICSDKTGTLTQNKMTVTELSSSKHTIKFSSSHGTKLLMLSSMCNNSSLNTKGSNCKVIGDPTEAALVIAAAKCEKDKTNLDAQYPRIKEISFDSKRKLMTTVHKLENGQYRVITKGAPDILLKLCNRYEDDEAKYDITLSTQNSIQRQNEIMATKALRVLAVAYKDVNSIPKNQSDIESSLVFLGLIGMIDPPRKEAKKAVNDCKLAGIKPVMITGDHILTAKAIAKDLGILSDFQKAMEGHELNNISQKELEEKIFDYSVFARVSPEHKVRIVKAFQKRGAVVAMTGDGVNDAPALKAADIGCAMGQSGTDVAKNAADMILTDDNFATIVEAVKQGRGIYENIKKTIRFLLSSNTGEIITVLIAFLIHLPSPLLAIQLLWVNLVTDSFPALALGVEPVDPDIMKKHPLNKKHSLFSGGAGYNIAIEGCFIGAISLLAFTLGRVFFDIGSTPTIGRTMAFAVLSLSQLIHAFNVRSEKSLFTVGFLGNIRMIYAFIVCLFLQVAVISIPVLSNIFKTAHLNFIQWFIVAALSLSPLVVVEIEKFFAIKLFQRKNKF